MTQTQKIIHGSVAMLFTLLVSGLFFMSQTVSAQDDTPVPTTVTDTAPSYDAGGGNQTPDMESMGMGTGAAPAPDMESMGMGAGTGGLSETPTGGVSERPTGGIRPAATPVGGKLTNPLQSQTIPEFLLKIIDVLLIFAMPIIILYIMYAGFLFVTAAGNTEQISTAKNALLWSVVGGVIVLGARVIISVIEGTIKAF